MTALPRPFHALTALACGASLLFAGCGSDDGGRPIPTGLSEKISGELDLVQRRVETVACNDLPEESYRDLERLMAQIPENVDPDVRDALRDGVNDLRGLADEECAQKREEKAREREERESADGDGDGIPDVEDPCPTESAPDTGGCPPVIPEEAPAPPTTVPEEPEEEEAGDEDDEEEDERA